MLFMLPIQYFPHVRRQQFWHFSGAYQLFFIVCNFERRSKTKVIPPQVVAVELYLTSILLVRASQRSGSASLKGHVGINIKQP